MLEREDDTLGFNIIGGRPNQVTPLLIPDSVCEMDYGSEKKKKSDVILKRMLVPKYQILNVDLLVHTQIFFMRELENKRTPHNSPT